MYSYAKDMDKKRTRLMYNRRWTMEERSLRDSSCHYIETRQPGHEQYNVKCLSH